jgi:hypothetical protein
MMIKYRGQVLVSFTAYNVPFTIPGVKRPFGRSRRLEE